jgi:transcriptional regulator with GAF, ATPase, and Fis domain
MVVEVIAEARKQRQLFFSGGEPSMDSLDSEPGNRRFSPGSVESERLRAQLEKQHIRHREPITRTDRDRQIVGESPALLKAMSDAKRVAETDAAVLLLGETGTGKELLARQIHVLSRRKDKMMVVVNCAALPATLVESELFGRDAGAYTGAASAQVGRVDLADGSTLFLDEIGEFPLELQAKLLRFLDDGRFERLGNPDTRRADVRIIAATNRNLEQAVRDGKFREDLYHRLCVFPIRVPPLRERRQDISLLTWTFVETFARRMGKTINHIPRSTLEQLERYAWPGNVRELRNAIERAMILATDDVLRVELPSLVASGRAPQARYPEDERECMLRVLSDVGWRIRGPGGAAEVLGLKPTTLESRLVKLGIKRPRRTPESS